MPAVDAGMQWYLSAFQMLSSSRQVGMAPGPIPLSEIAVYWQISAIDPLMDTTEIIRAMDAAWLNHAREARDQK